MRVCRDRETRRHARKAAGGSGPALTTLLGRLGDSSCISRIAPAAAPKKPSRRLAAPRWQEEKEMTFELVDQPPRRPFALTRNSLRRSGFLDRLVSDSSAHFFGRIVTNRTIHMVNKGCGIGFVHPEAGFSWLSGVCPIHRDCGLHQRRSARVTRPRVAWRRRRSPRDSDAVPALQKVMPPAASVFAVRITPGASNSATSSLPAPRIVARSASPGSSVTRFRSIDASPCRRWTSMWRSRRSVVARSST